MYLLSSGFRFNVTGRMMERARKSFSVVVVITMIMVNISPVLVYADESAPTETPPIEESVVEEEPPPPAEETAGDVGSAGDTTTDEQADSGDTWDAGDGGEAEGTAVIETGDAVAVGSAVNEVNTNDTDTDGISDEPETLPGEDAVDDAADINTEVIDEENTIDEGDGVVEETEGDGIASTTIDATDDESATDAGSTTTPDTIELSPDAQGDTASTSLPDSSESSGDTGSSTAEILGGSDDATASSTADIVVDNDNAAVAQNDLDVNAETGENTVVGGGGAVIDTGNAYAVANVVNIINTNIFNSEGLILLLNALFGSFSVDLRDLNLFGGSGFSCPGGCGSNTAVHIDNNNTAEVTNNVVVRASTGENTASSTTGTSTILTGDAYAAANVANLVNTNITNSQYLLLTLNNFGDWGGDFILPGADFFSQFYGGNTANGCNCAGDTTITNNNEATVENDVEVGADTGANTVAGDGESVVVTGDANAGANVINQVNTNLFGGSSFMLLLRVHGNWSGNIFSTPPGIVWQETPFGIQIYDDGSSSGAGSASTAGTGSGYGSTTVNNTNTATVANNINVTALTGENKINAGGGATIATGNANAAANVFNLVNTNIYGRNWIFAIINIFGDWAGDIAFGRPDLWVGSRAESSGNIEPNSQVDYHFTIFNRGDADATNVQITNIFDGRFIAFEGNDSNWISSPNRVVWDVGTVRAGESIEVSYSSVISPNIPSGRSAITNEVIVSSTETDNEVFDNSDTITIIATNTDRNGGGGGGGYNLVLTPDPKLNIVKSYNASSTITASSSVDYEIVITNDGYGSAYNAVLTDVLTDEEGNVVHEEQWNLGEIFQDEEITVTYTTIFNEYTRSGLYTNTAQVTAIGGHPSTNPFYGYFADSPVATTTIEILAIVSEEDNPDDIAIGGTLEDPALAEAVELFPAGAAVVAPETAVADIVKTIVAAVQEEIVAIPLPTIIEEETREPVPAILRDERAGGGSPFNLASIGLQVPALFYWWILLLGGASIGITYQLSRYKR